MVKGTSKSEVQSMRLVSVVWHYMLVENTSPICIGC